MRINDLIRISPVRLVDDNNEQVGVIPLDEAKQRAREAGLDLVEVSPMSSPPVCRIMDYGKWKYQQKKKEQKARSHSKQSELKEVRLRPKIDEHDLQIKTDKAREFLLNGDKVQFTVQFRGREMAHQDFGFKALKQIRDGLELISKVEAEPRVSGKRMTMVLAPDHRGGKPKTIASDAKPAAPPSAATGPAATPAPPTRVAAKPVTPLNPSDMPSAKPSAPLASPVTTSKN
jgi:translation initiation factor IF-3